MRVILLAALAAAVGVPDVVHAQVPAPAGGEFRINTFTTGEQSGASAAADAAGRFVVVWHSEGADGDGFGVVGQRIDASGARLGSEFTVNQQTTGEQQAPSVAALPDGRFLVVWAQADPAAGPWSIRGRSFRASGLTAGPEVAISTSTSSTGRPEPHAAAIPGGFVVVWSAPASACASCGYGRLFHPENGPLGAEFRIAEQTGSGQILPVAAGLPNGAYVLAWSDRGTPLQHVWVRFFDTNGPQGPEMQADILRSAFNTEYRHSVAITSRPNGEAIVSWVWQACQLGKDPVCSGEGAFARHYDAAGTPVGTEFAAHDSGRAIQPSLSSSQRGAAVIAWTTDPGWIFARRLGPELLSTQFRVNTYTGFQVSASAASDPAGNTLIVWQSLGQDGSSFGIYGQRYGGLSPAALDLDTSGNHVWEPGESVDLRPAWRNVNGAAVAFSGTLSGLTGPGSATYTITDSSGNYGSVANGATAPCTDCYGVAVTAPANRPFTHWDASAVETLAPDTQGQQVRWPLHIGNSFSDVPISNPFYRFIETLLHRGVTAGCTATTYCPGVATTREQMAVFVLVAKEGAGYAPPACSPPNIFNDVPETSPFCRYIEELANRGVVGGCAPNQYCGASPVTREQMAVFVLRTLDPTLDPPLCVPPNIFNDMPETSPFCRWVEELANRGIVSGCAPGQYCGSAPVTREQMGVFLGVTFGLTLYGL